MLRIKHLLFLVMASFVCLPGCQKVKEQPKPSPPPPALSGRIEARLSYLEGEVSFKKGPPLTKPVH